MLVNSIRDSCFLTVAILFIAACAQRKEAETIPGGPKVPEGFSVELAAGPDLVDFPMFATLDETGRLFVFESTGNVYDNTADALKDPKFRIKLLLDMDADGRPDLVIPTYFGEAIAILKNETVPTIDVTALPSRIETEGIHLRYLTLSCP